MRTKLLLFFVFIQAAMFAQTAPNLIVTDLEGTTHNLYDYLDEGKTVILDFFIVNCTSCEDGAPHLDEFWNTYGPNGSEQIQIMSIEISNATNQQVANIASQWGIENPIVNLSSAPTSFDPFIQSFPTYLVICPDKSMTSLIDFEYPETILAWEQSLNSCDFGNDFTDVNILANEFIHCQKNVQGNLVIGNVGTTNVNDITIDVFVDSIYSSTINWNYPLPPNENTNSTPYPIWFESTSVEGNSIEFVVNTADDVNPINNTISQDLSNDIITPNTELSLIIKMDNYPSDLIWQLTNSTDDVIFEGIGDDYSSYEEVEFTTILESEDCYTFTLVDLIGDGLCCSFGEGYFDILSGEDTLISNIYFESHFVESFYVGNEIGLEENAHTSKRIVNRLYYNIMGQSINYPIKKGVYLEQTIFEDETFETKKIILSRVNL
jgi:thiol-disulfide isomerase/thioredoxin